MSNLSDRRLYAAAAKQAARVRFGNWAAADFEYSAEEIESMGGAEKRELVSRRKVLLIRLATRHHQPIGRSVARQLGIKNQCRQGARHVAETPSLKAGLDEMMAVVYGDAILAAARKSSQSEAIFPDRRPWAFE